MNDQLIFNLRDFKYMKNYDVVNFAYQIIQMNEQINILQDEVERLQEIEKDYNTLLGESVRYGQEMMGGMLKILLTPKVAETFLNSKVDEPV